MAVCQVSPSLTTATALHQHPDCSSYKMNRTVLWRLFSHVLPTPFQALKTIYTIYLVSVFLSVGFFLSPCVCVCLSVCLCVWGEGQRATFRGQFLLITMWVWGLKHGSSLKAATALNNWAIFLVSCCLFLFFLNIPLFILFCTYHMHSGASRDQKRSTDALEL